MRRIVVQATLMAFSFHLQAQAATISPEPLATQNGTAARANLMFVFDDSGSMARDYLPETANYNNACFGYHGTNTIFYNPSTTYVLPPQYTGTPFPAATFNNAYINGYAQSGTKTDLSNLANLTTDSIRVGTTSGGAAINSKFYYATPKTGSPNPPACGGSYDWTKWDFVTTLPAAQQQNYANWYSFYRTRMLLMRGAVGQVFADIDARRFRIGYNAISDYQYNNGTKFLRIGDFDAGTQKQDFYTKLYSAASTGSTPLRSALEKVGKYYAGRQLNGSALPSGADPLQYSCQRNYALLATDGYWNLGDEPTGYSPTRLNGSTAIGNTDGGASISVERRDTLGVSNSLADIAQYFFDTDLRDPLVTGTSCTGSIATENVCTNNVAFEAAPTNLPIEQVQHQRMVTYTLGLGLAGNLTYRSDYDTATSGDFASIKQGTLAWPNPNVTSTSATVVTRVDDLWHAAVNGRGRYYSASNPADVAVALGDALQNITAATGTASSAATSSQLPVNGDNFAYVGQYTTVLWEGNLLAYTIDTSTGIVSNTPLWQANSTLKAQVGSTSDTRTILFRDTSVTGTQLANFDFTNLNTAGLGANFTNACATGNYKLSQCSSLVGLGATVQAAANNGDNMVNFLRGRTGNEDLTANALNSRLFRGRPNTPLGDIVNAAPVYVKKPPFKYTDSGYAAFQSANASRTGVVYVAANDGMLHALNASNGSELWAYVPRAVMQNMYLLADSNYDALHTYYVDGTPVVGDVFDGTSWRTILVGGLGAGGRAYYALDITNPASPKSLWEFSVSNDNDLGLTFGNPVITKNKAGTWVVAFTSGYNNVSPGNGNGHLFVLNAVTGATISKISTFTSGTTPAGTTTTLSDLGKINPWVDAETDNTAKRFYAGDMLGYMWRFDFDNNIAPTGNEAMLLGRALTSGGVPQPITTKPIAAKISGTTANTVSFATGRYLGLPDVSNTDTQSLYVIKDTLGTTGLGTVRTNSGMVAQTMTAARTVTTQLVDWTIKNGWYIDFSGPVSGERVNVDMIQTGKLLAVATNQPSPTACNAGGNSALYFFNIATGGLTNATIPFTELTAGLSFIITGSDQTGGGTLRLLRTDVKGKSSPFTPTTTGGGAGTTRRTSWRELVN
jgi:type IV pilus assembly protein PilY1